VVKWPYNTQRIRHAGAESVKTNHYKLPFQPSIISRAISGRRPNGRAEATYTESVKFRAEA
jgi:hypothetical protein